MIECSKVLPELPTFREMNLTHYAALRWTGMCETKAVTENLFSKITEAISARASDSYIAKRLSNFDIITPTELGPTTLSEDVRASIEE